MKSIAAAINTMSQEDIAKFEETGTFMVAGYSLIPEDVEILTENMPGWLVMNEGALTIALDIELTESLLEEGIARELINRIQNIRKSAGFEVTDRIEVEIEDCTEVHNAVLHFKDYIASQVLARHLDLTSTPQGEEVELNGKKLHIKVEK